MRRRGGVLKKMALGLFAAAVISTGAIADEAKKLKIIFVSPLGPGNAFVLPILKGFELAGSQLGVDVTFRGNQDANILAPRRRPSACSRTLSRQSLTGL